MLLIPIEKKVFCSYSRLKKLQIFYPDKGARRPDKTLHGYTAYVSKKFMPSGTGREFAGTKLKCYYSDLIITHIYRTQQKVDFTTGKSHYNDKLINI